MLVLPELCVFSELLHNLILCVEIQSEYKYFVRTCRKRFFTKNFTNFGWGEGSAAQHPPPGYATFTLRAIMEISF